MWQRLLLSAILTMLAGAGCAQNDTADVERCGELHQPGTYEGLGASGDLEQPYWIVVPETYADLAPAPLFVNLSTGSGSHDENMDGWGPYLEDVPGLMAIVNTQGRARTEPTALLALLDHIEEEYCVDPQRIHVMGTAWVAPVAEDLACTASTRIAAFAAASSAKSDSRCQPDRPVPLLSLTGDPDRSDTEEIVTRWIGFNECDIEPQVEDLGSGVLRKTYQNCAADVLYFDIQGAPHCFFLHEAKGPATGWICEYEEVDYLEEAYRFFAEHPLP